MSRYKDKFVEPTFTCPRGCGSIWHPHVYVYTDSACRKTWWRLGPGGYCPKANKACPTVRVIRSCGKYVIHPATPGWRDDEPVKRCC